MIGEWIQDHFGWLIVVSVVLAIALLVVVAVADEKYHRRLIAQCQAGGKAEYECYALIRGKRR